MDGGAYVAVVGAACSFRMTRRRSIPVVKAGWNNYDTHTHTQVTEVSPRSACLCTVS